jgi:hypothetical protein
VKQQFDSFVSSMCFGGAWNWFRPMFVSYILFVAVAPLQLSCTSLMLETLHLASMLAVDM